jgi:hypothetical protein
MFSGPIFEKYSYKTLMKIHQVGTELFHEDGRTDKQTDRETEMAKLILTTLYFATVPIKHVSVPYLKSQA